MYSVDNIVLQLEFDFLFSYNYYTYIRLIRSSVCFDLCVIFFLSYHNNSKLNFALILNQVMTTKS